MEKNKELTPMMELIEQLEKEIKFINEDDSKEDRYYQAGLKLAYAKAKSLLPKEKQVIEDAHNDGHNYYEVNGIDAETYYNTKYNNQIK